MNVTKQITRLDAVVLLLSILLLWNFAAVGGSGRERARQAVCLANLKQLTSAWLSYAEGNDGRIVNGAAGMDRIWSNKREKAWVGQCWASNFAAGGQLPKETQNMRIGQGALWPHVQETRLYRCPSGYPDQMLTYAAVDAVNGLNSFNGRIGVSVGSSLSDVVGTRVGDTVLWLKKMSEIVSPPAAERMVFIDEGWSTPDSFAVNYHTEQWWDGPPVRHGDGTSVSFADGHCEDWQWRGEETILAGRARRFGYPPASLKPATPEDKDDLHRLQKAVWGRLGY